MKKSIWIFLLAVLLPSVVLGWLALHSAEEQQIILEKRTAELYQKETENAAGAVRALIDGERRTFNDAVRRMLANKNPAQAERDFSVELVAAWPRKAVGFALGKEGRLISPSAESARKSAEKQKFLFENSAFLCSALPATVYWVSGNDLNLPDALRRKYNGPEPQFALKNSAPSQPQAQQITLAGKGPNSVSISAPGNGAMAGNAGHGARGNDEAPAKAMAEPPGAAALGEPAIPAIRSGDSVAPAPVPAIPSLNQAAAPALAPTAGAAAPASPAMPVPAAAPVAKALARTKESGGSTAFKAGTRSAAPADKRARAAVPAGGVEVPAGIAAPDRALRKDVAAPKEAEAPAKTASMAPASLPAPAPMAEQPLPPIVQVQGEQSTVRNVAPQRMPEGDNNAVLSQIMPSTADFRTLTAGENEGVITRFVQDQLEVLFWVRPAQDPDTIFGCLIESENLSDLWPAALPAPEASSLRERYAGRGASEFTLALLDDKARPVATQPPAEKGRDWKRPFVASEIGEALPHWEAALYLQRPEQLRESAVAVRRTLTFLIAGALAAIACGGWLVVADARRQLALAQQKTDFVSNVSHELKTPLTSIRMFAELMQSGRPGMEGKHPQYLRIIMVEAERLTRLINNVLDFARIERRQKRYDKKPVDLHEVIGRIWEGHELHLREAGFTTRWEAAPAPYPVIGDDDALAQILVNLLSNAEKYSGERKEVEIQSYIDDGRVCVSVLDRGLGVPTGEERKVFEAFYRAHDSLSSGIQGSGLGLTLAQRLAREHGGEVLYQSREGGGSNFTLRLPLAPQPTPPLV